MGSLIKNKLDKCFSTVVNLESFCFSGSAMPSGLCPSVPDRGLGAPARQLFPSLQPVRPGPHVPSAKLSPTALQAQCGAQGGRRNMALGMICYRNLVPSPRSQSPRVAPSITLVMAKCLQICLSPFLGFSLSK